MWASKASLTKVLLVLPEADLLAVDGRLDDGRGGVGGTSSSAGRQSWTNDHATSERRPISWMTNTARGMGVGEAQRASNSAWTQATASGEGSSQSNS